MQIVVNGEIKTVNETLTVQELIEQLALTGRRLAIEVNQAIVPRSQFGLYRLQAQDKIEIVHAIGGG
ncbi:sulfur carrier protein ThiS [Beggiatoa leptomitoformis]|uniref:Sulfur carrier protein ThiS n=2 Tax=Beggiatoa leptomitoformis TaxID=288004 RepID=A0A2N9YJM6_9GAMM|nr:sulfur carrier protein ThiS [Beggiatoa leptomitoformis]AUI70689.1 sulfur carrier protein ThiS [Beggiatoa leptomitoformis]